jgi:hypothetical protein
MKTTNEMTDAERYIYILESTCKRAKRENWDCEEILHSFEWYLQSIEINMGIRREDGTIK